MYGHSLIKVFERVKELGLTDSRRSFSLDWCGKDESYMYDYYRRGGTNRLIRAELVSRIRSRLAEVASISSNELAREVRALDAAITRDAAVAALLCRAHRIDA